MGSLKDETLIKLAGQKPHSQETIDDVEKKTKDMSVVQGAMNTARELSGANTLEKQVVDANDRADKAQKERDKAVEDKHKAEIEKVEETLGAKIDNLAKSYTAGASKETIADQIAGIKKAANELGMGTSKVSELREMMNLITSLNPQKSLVEQIKDAKELINVIVPHAEQGKEFSIGGMPANVALELKKMDTNLQITLEQMKDDRERRNQDFELRIKQYDLEREDRIAEANAKIVVEQDRNKMIAGGLETIGRAIGRGMAEGSQQSPHTITGKASEPAKSYHIELAPDESADFDCPTPGCGARIAVGPDSTEATCVGCNTKFPVIRKAVAEMQGPPPPTEEE
jgi:hypothetical protein